MRTPSSTPFRPIICGSLLFATALVGCGNSERAEGADSGTAAAESSAAATAVAASPSPATDAGRANAETPLTVGDIDRWQRGMTGEATAVNEAIAKLATAKSETDSTNVVLETAETFTRAAGARAAGVDEARYQLLASSLSNLASQLAPLEGEMDVASMPAAMVDAMKEARATGAARASAGVAPEVIAAVTARAAALRAQEKALLAARAKALGMVR